MHRFITRYLGKVHNVFGNAIGSLHNPYLFHNEMSLSTSSSFKYNLQVA